MHLTKNPCYKFKSHIQIKVVTVTQLYENYAS